MLQDGDFGPPEQASPDLGVARRGDFGPSEQAHPDLEVARQGDFGPPEQACPDLGVARQNNGTTRSRQGQRGKDCKGYREAEGTMQEPDLESKRTRPREEGLQTFPAPAGRPKRLGPSRPTSELEPIDWLELGERSRSVRANALCSDAEAKSAKRLSSWKPVPGQAQPLPGSEDGHSLSDEEGADAALVDGVWQTDSSRHAMRDSMKAGKGHLVVPPLDNKPVLSVAYFFSGVQRKSSVANALAELCRKSGFGLSFYEVDILIAGQEHDLISQESQDDWLRRVESGEFFMIILSPPCGTWSRANYAGGKGPKPCRSKRYPWGFPYAKEAMRARAE